MTRIGIFAASTAVAIALLWVAPIIGLIAIAIALIIIPPWGKTYAERAVISGVVILGAAAIIFPRAGSTPVDAFTARSFLSALAIIAVALYLIPQLKNTPLPKPRVTEAALVLVAAGLTYWLIAAYLGTSAEQLLSGLYFSGWDNHGHFTTFANTYTANSTTWPTTDGSIAWNQWYPSLHTTLWALLEFAGGSTGLGRVELLFPYIQWNALTFALSVVALAWVASDLAGRWAKELTSKRAAQIATLLAAVATGTWILFGSPQFLYNAGFTNFVMGIAVVTTASYLSVRTVKSARTLGWFLVPLAAIDAIALWTPLAITLIPAGVIVAIALIRFKPAIGITWLVANAIVGGVLAWQQGRAILAAEDGASANEFAETIGAVGTGMAPFNIAAAIAAPFLALAIAVALRHHRPLAFGIAGPSVLTGVLALAFIPGTDAAGVSRISSYYVLKSLDAALLATAPLLAAAAATAFVFLLRHLSTTTAIATATAASIAGVTAFGYIGSTPRNLSSGFTVAPGVQAGIDRARGIDDQLIGESILGTVQATDELPGYSPMMWDGAGTLPNLWAASLHETLTSDEQAFYAGLPEFPYGTETGEYIRTSLAADRELRLAITWFREVSGDFLRLRFGTDDPRRVQVVQVPMRQSLLCPECTG
ncbi:MAG TPA: hypothetical protein VIG24_14835 [Acidimicrobiia bacterium]